MSNTIPIKKIHTDILVIGDGISGRIAAYISAKNGSDVVIATKGKQASNYILGFNAPILKNDSAELYAEDTYYGGKSIADRKMVQTLCREISDIIPELENLGMNFDRSGDGYDLLKPLGCSMPRLLHSSNKTGKSTMELFGMLLKRLHVRILGNMMLMELNVSSRKISGALVFDLNSSQLICIEAKAVILACGGVHIATGSTYPESMTGDGYAAAYRSGAELCDLEFIQFEPCRCIYPQKLGISTTLLAKGGKIFNADGERFLVGKYEGEGNIPKDELARLIEIEIQKGKATEHGGVYLDLTDVPKEEIVDKHSLYYQRFLSVGIDLTKEKIEVAPGAHSFMGGIVVDENCQTGIDGLFACGEVTGGLHGANRVGGNAGTEVFVFGKRCGISASGYVREKVQSFCPLPHIATGGADDVSFYERIIYQVRETMKNHMSPIRCEFGMQRAYDKIKDISDSLEQSRPSDFQAYVKWYEARNLSLIATLSCRFALLRTESRGVHFRSDFPYENPDFGCSTHIIGGNIYSKEYL